MNYYIINYWYPSNYSGHYEGKGLLAVNSGESPLTWFISNSPHGHKMQFSVKITEERFNELRQQKVRDLRNEFKGK